MSWTLYRWTWRLRAPLYLGLPPAGSLNRTRLFVPARPLWGALTAELARHEGNGAFPKYSEVGADLRKNARLGYLYPAEIMSGEWRAWLPQYDSGLVWIREGDQETLSDRDFRRRVLHTRPGTSIDPVADAAEDGSLRETECIQLAWRAAQVSGESTVAMTGYVFLRGDSLRRRLEGIRKLFVGGDTRYGLGLIERTDDLVEATTFFGDAVELAEDSPCVIATVVRSHAISGNEAPALRGDRERVLSWNDGKLEDDVGISLWRPGSWFSGAKWSLSEHGFWGYALR